MGSVSSDGKQLVVKSLACDCGKERAALRELGLHVTEGHREVEVEGQGHDRLRDT